jgi:hypothetical protein
LSPRALYEKLAGGYPRDQSLGLRPLIVLVDRASLLEYEEKAEARGAENGKTNSNSKCISIKQVFQCAK